MTADALALLVNDIHLQGGCLVREGWQTVLISSLSAALATQMAGLADAAGLSPVILDEANHDVDLADVDDIGGPYRLSLTKPAPDGIPQLLTLKGFDDLLADIGERAIIHVAALAAPFETLATVFVPWDADAQAAPPLPSPKSPRNLVREYSDVRLAPATIGLWLLRQPMWLERDPVFRRWATLATRQCLLAIGNELQDSPLSIVFKGPPRGVMLAPDVNANVDETLFTAVQASAQWVYEAPTETEMRHPLLSAEIARFSSVDGKLQADPAIFRPALDGARLAYDLGLSKLSSDTLKMLTDLRKSVLDEATKVSDSSRQLVASVATTLSVGVGLVAAKIGANADGRIVGVVAVIATVYVFSIVWAGFRALDLQDNIRDQWKSRTYGFISQESYDDLVEYPAKKAAAAYRSVARICLYLATAMIGVIVWSIATFP
ncbi:hypothetical protein SAMN02800694_2619 [Luteibacter sp. UNCMF331Sha3.1]|uniref:hypothetical protein n=1 Tax=Luteibacter sp. UNCMF331Sha3.1 TaxID=1502760 RepID=UPI0008B3EC02|nr:hypothetical protein [Luteibacter sp. UNCMF331Sha3.1]SEN05304.1 hypothetical protein SAMN02800694_2619 [Luteibacter sp. UNCMF331Sha3.1]